MTVTTGTITTAKTAQAVSGVTPSSLTTCCYFTNQHPTDQMVVSYDGVPASQTHGLIMQPGLATDLLPFFQASNNLGALSVWGMTTGAPFSINAQ